MNELLLILYILYYIQTAAVIISDLQYVLQQFAKKTN
jgi:hypothetical protein